MSDLVMDEAMMDDDAGKSEQSNRVSTSAGQQLAARREALGWSIEQVSSQLNLATRQIHALETDNFAALPGMAISRGFIRAYAKLLKIDPAPLLALVSNETTTTGEPVPMRHALSASFSESRLPSMGSDGPSNKRLSIGLLAVVLIGGSVAALQLGALPEVSDALSAKMKALLSSHDPVNQNSTVAKSGATEGTIVKPVDGTSATDSAQNATSASTPTPTAPEEKAPEQTISAATNKMDVATPVQQGQVTPAPAPAPIAAAPTAVPAPTPAASNTPVAASAAAPVTASTVPAMPSKDALILKIREDSWVEIKGSKKVLISRVVKAGSTESFDIAEPVSLTIGNASGVDGEFRGVAIDFKNATKTNVVKMSLK